VNADMILTLVASLGWLFFAGASVASFRLGWSKFAKMALVWIAIFTGLYVLTEWSTIAQNTASTLL